MKFIPDCQRCLSDADDLLGTSVYADALYKTIDENYNHEKLTIGLFGGWGSGKSSIIKTLENKIVKSEKSKKMHIFIYDAWKYTGDAFRRSFLLEINKNMGDSLPENIKNEISRFYTDKHEDTEHRIGLSQTWWLNILIFLPFLMYILLFVQIDNTLKTFIALLAPFLSGLTFLIKNSLFEYKISISNSKFFSPEQFETLFIKIVDEYIKKEKKDKIIIVIDNIDRCDKETAKEAIIAIKNFLESSNCIFIVPVDNCAIIKSLGLSKIDGEEFLRKIFNTTIRIKNYSNVDLFSFTKNIIKKYDLGFSDEVADILSYEFPKNPRRIIQILNSLISEYNVALRQEEKGYITNATITKNLDFLAKIQVIREEWPELYDKICSDIKLIDRINQCIKEGKDFKELELSEQQYIYLSKTRLISVKNIEPFIKLRDFDKDINDNIMDFIRNGELNKVNECILNKDISIERLVDIILSELDDKLNKKNLWKVSGFSLLNLIFSLSVNKGFQFEIFKHIKELRKYLENYKLREIIYHFDSEKIVDFSVELSKVGEESLRNQIVYNIQKHENNENNLLIIYVKKYSYDPRYLLDIKEQVSDCVFISYDSYLDFKNIINIQNVNNLINLDKLVDHIRKLKDATDSEDIKNCVDFLRWLNSIKPLDAKANNIYLLTLHNLLSIRNNDINLTIFYLAAMKGFLQISDENVEYKETLIKIFNLIDSFYNNFFTQVYNRRSRMDILIKANLTLIDLFAEMYLSSTNLEHQSFQRIETYFNKNEEKELYEFAADKLLKFVSDKEVYNWPFSQSVINRYNTIGNVESIKKITPLLNEMIIKTTSKLGLNNVQLAQLVEYIFSFYTTSSSFQQDESKILLHSIIQNDDTTTYFLQRLDRVSESSTLDKFLDFLNEIKETKIRKKIVVSKILLAKDYNNLVSGVSTIRSSFKDANPYIRIGLITKIDCTAGQEYMDTIRLCVEEQQIFNDTAEGKAAVDDIIDRLQSIICGNGSLDDKKFALKQLSILNDYSVNKFPIVKNCLDKFKSDENEDIVKVLETIRKKLKQK